MTDEELKGHMNGFPDWLLIGKPNVINLNFDSSTVEDRLERYDGQILSLEQFDRVFGDVEYYRIGHLFDLDNKKYKITSIIDFNIKVDLITEKCNILLEDGDETKIIRADVLNLVLLNDITIRVKK